MSNTSRDARYARAFAAFALASPSLRPSDSTAARCGRAIVTASPSLRSFPIELSRIEAICRRLAEETREHWATIHARPDDVASGWGA